MTVRGKEGLIATTEFGGIQFAARLQSFINNLLDQLYGENGNFLMSHYAFSTRQNSKRVIGGTGGDFLIGSQ